MLWQHRDTDPEQEHTQLHWPQICSSTERAVMQRAVHTHTHTHTHTADQVRVSLSPEESESAQHLFLWTLNSGHHLTLELSAASGSTRPQTQQRRPHHTWLTLFCTADINSSEHDWQWRERESVCVCVCVCESEWERESERDCWFIWVENSPPCVWRLCSMGFCNYLFRERAEARRFTLSPLEPVNARMFLCRERESQTHPQNRPVSSHCHTHLHSLTHSLTHTHSHTHTLQKLPQEGSDVTMKREGHRAVHDGSQSSAWWESSQL